MSQDSSGGTPAAGASPETEGQPGIGRRLFGGIVIVVLMLTLPAVVGYFLGGESIAAATGAAEGSLVGLLIAITCGRQRVFVFLPVLAIAALYIITLPHWWYENAHNPILANAALHIQHCWIDGYENAHNLVLANTALYIITEPP